jgi:hypothetical protein
MQVEFFSDSLHLSLVGIANRVHFLQGNDVGIQFFQDVDDTLQADPAIHAPTFMDVVSDNSHGNFYPAANGDRVASKDYRPANSLNTIQNSFCPTWHSVCAFKTGGFMYLPIGLIILILLIFFLLYR